MECENTAYEISNSFDSFPHPGFIFDYLVTYLSTVTDSEIPPTISFDELSETLACVYIYYDELKMTTIEQTPSKMIVDVLANIGIL